MGRRFAIWILLSLVAQLCAPAAAVADAGISIVDDAGRRVSLAEPARRVVLTDGMGLVSLALLDQRPVSLLAGWNRSRMDADALASLRPALPGIDAVPDIGDLAAGGAALEKVIALAPDLVILDPFYNRSAGVLQKLEAAGIAVAVLALTPSVRDLDVMRGLERFAVLLGRRDRARDYVDFVTERLERIRSRAGALVAEERPPVLLEPHAGPDTCCISTGGGQGIGDFIGFVGGRNIGADVIPGMAGPLSLEYVIGSEPLVYIGTGGAYMAPRGGLVLGAGTDVARACGTLEAVLSRPGISEIPAVRTGRAYGMSHGLAISALNVVAIEAFATWVHPDLFADVDPQATLDEIGTRFLPAPLAGTWWVGMHASCRQ